MNTPAMMKSLFTALALHCSMSISAATITIINADGPGEGFHDPTPIDPVGGNPGTTLGQQRLEVFRYAASIWEGLIVSPVEIKVEAQFDPLTCDQFSAVLGSAGTTTIHRDFAGAALAGTWYPQSLANALAGTDLSTTYPDLSATFNSAIDNNDSCLSETDWYLGLDGNAGNDIDLADVVLHEIGHGLGFASYVDETSGTPFMNYLDVFSANLEDHSENLTWDQMTNAERAASAIDDGDLHFVGGNVVFAAGHVPMYAPDSVQPGSSVSHFDDSLSPNELMEPFISDPPIHDVGLAYELMLDLGWTTEGQPGNTVPSVLISSPSPGDVFPEGSSVNLVASANDAEDSDLDSSITWDSDVDGVLGLGASLTVGNLSVGEHTLTASVTDSGGDSASDSVSIAIEAVAEAVPAAPSLTQVSDLGNGSAKVDWTDNSNNEDAFDILRESPHKKRPNVWVGTTLVGWVGAGVTTYTDASGGGKYRYCVRATNGSGTSTWSCSAVIEITDSSGGGGGGSFCDTHPDHRRCR